MPSPALSSVSPSRSPAPAQPARPASLLEAFRRLRGRLAAKILFSERLNRWLHPDPAAVIAAELAAQDDSPDGRYRAFNRDCFADFYEQEKMLADRPRMDFYHAAIHRHIRPGAHVIDLGTGTGILAAFASRAGAARVHAIDHSQILDHARTLAAHNHVEHVAFVHTHSRDFTLPAPVDAIIHEQMGDYLLDEDMLTNIADLRDRLLKPGGLILPARFELFVEPVKVKDSHFTPLLWELNVHGIDYACMDRARPQHPSYYHIPGRDLDQIEHFLCEPTPLLTLDLHTFNPGDLPAEFRRARPVKNPGRLDGYVVYFRALVDDDLALTTSPFDPQRATNWGYRLLRTDRDTLAAGDTLDFILKADRWSDPMTWRWSHVKKTPASQKPPL